MQYDKTIIITGGCGFIGSHVVRKFVKKYPNYLIINLDAMTYAGDKENVKDIASEPNYRFIHADITDSNKMMEIFRNTKPDAVIHLAAESHVDNSIKKPLTFLRTNVVGTVNLLNAALDVWGGNFEGKRFYQVSTDEVYGELEILYPDGVEFDAGIHYGIHMFKETMRYDPRSPYSASKASADMFVRAYHHTYGLPVVITNCSNNYGPNQFPEKLIPVIIKNIVTKKPIPVYGDGLNVRDWLYVEDHADAIDLVFHNGDDGETYLIGGNNERKNIDIVKTLIKVTDQLLGNPEGTSESLITYVEDRKGHDRRYAINTSKIYNNLGWKPTTDFETGIEKTVQWYLDAFKRGFLMSR